MTFQNLNLAPEIVSAVNDMGYTQPTPIQTQSIPIILNGQDLLASAQTGTGKTAAFSLPLLQILAQKTSVSKTHLVRALVLSPTRELAAQIEENVCAYAKNLTLRSAVVFGGVGMTPQIKKLQHGVDILIATPGRLLDLHAQGYIDFSHVEHLVLDEADRMLDMGFIHDVKKILAALPDNKQSLLFSATFSDEIKTLAASLLKNPEHVQVTPPNSTVQRITQAIYPVGRTQKKAALIHIIQSHNWNQVLVFTRTKFSANNVASFLNEQGVSAMALHGNKSQTARTLALSQFKSGDLRVLVATDIAARGIDIDELPHVVNFEIPNVPEDYVHRIGRTGRAGSEGHAISLVSMDEEGFMMTIERFTQQQIPVEILSEFGPEPDEKAEPIVMGGRQILWGGAGKPPSREVMQAAAKAARREVMQRIQAKRRPNANPRQAAAHTDQANGANEAAHSDGSEHIQHQPAAGERNHSRQGRLRSGLRTRRPRPQNSNTQHRNAETTQQPPATDGTGFKKPRPARQGYDNAQANNPRRTNQPNRPRSPQLRADAHLGTQTGMSLAPSYRGDGSRQPDPMRTSIDSMAERGRRSGGRSGGGNKRKNNDGGKISPLQHNGLMMKRGRY